MLKYTVFYTVPSQLVLTERPHWFLLNPCIQPWVEKQSHIPISSLPNDFLVLKSVMWTAHQLSLPFILIISIKLKHLKKKDLLSFLEREQAGGAEGERARTPSRLRPECGAQCGAHSHNPEITTWMNRVRCFTHCATQTPLNWNLFWYEPLTC